MLVDGEIGDGRAGLVSGKVLGFVSFCLGATPSRVYSRLYTQELFLEAQEI